MKNSFAKILSLVLALIMLISVVPSAALARNVGTGETNVLTGWFDWWRDFLNPRPRPNPGYPAQSLEAKPVNGVSVNAEIPVGSLPAGTTLDVAGVNDIASFQHVCDELNFPGHILTAVDISFMSNGEEVEPRRPVTITMSSDALIDAENVQIIHFPCDANGIANMDGRPEVITDYYLSGNTISFDADQFSVYAVSGGSSSGGNLLTVEFYAKDTNGTWQKINTQAIRMSKIASMDAPVFDPGVPTVTSSQSFEGWAKTQAEAESDDTDGISVAEINSEIKNSGYDANSVSKTLMFYAMVFNVRYVVYHDQAGAVMMTQAYHVHGNNPESVEIDWSYVGFKGGQNFAGWVEESAIATNTQGDLLLGDYPLYKDNVGQVYENGVSYNLSETLQLYPYLNTGHWLTFDNNLSENNTLNDFDDSTPASYTSPVFVAENVNTAAPATPTRTGYTFGGWFKDENLTQRFIFGSRINEDTTVYAKWTPKNTTYHVVFWIQKITDTPSTTDENKEYDFWKDEPRPALTGSAVSINSDTTGETADNRLGYNSDTSIGELGYYFIYSTKNVAGETATVNGDGSTTLNVYYDRKEITFRFGNGTAQYYVVSNPDWSKAHSGNPYYVGNDHTEYFYNSGYYYRYRGEYGSVSMSTSGTTYYTIYQNTICKCVYQSHTWYLDYYNSNYYLDEGDPIYTRSSSAPSGTVYEKRMVLQDANVTSIISGLYGSQLNPSDWPDEDDGMVWACYDPYASRVYLYPLALTEFVPTYHNGGTTVQQDFYQTEFTTNTVDVHYVGQELGGTAYNVALANGVTRKGSAWYPTETIHGFTITGYRFGTSGNWTDCDRDSKIDVDEDETNALYVSFTRNTNQVFFYSNNTEVTPSGVPASFDLTKVPYQTNLSALASVKPTNAPEGCYFDGWFADPACKVPFDFNVEMPDNNIRIYAKWTMERFRVVCDPTGGETGVQPSDITFPGNQTTTFCVDYGEVVQGSSLNNAKRDGYTLLGWFLDPEYTIPFNFGQPITDEIADMGYAAASAAERQGTDPWNSEDPTYSDVGCANVRGKVVIYAHWRKNPDGIIGINVHYDATDKDGNTGKFSDNSAEWNDPNIYADKAKAFGQPASTPDDSDLQFLYWEILDANNNNAVVGKAYPGQLWTVNVDWAKVTDLTAKAVYYTYGDKKTAEGKVTGSSTRSGADALEANTLTTTVFSDNFDEGTDFTTSTSSSGTMSTEYWTAYNPGYGNNWSNYSSNTYAHSGSRSAVYQYNPSYAANCYLISKPFKISSNAASVAVSLYERVYSSSYAEQFEVFFIVTDGITTNGAAINDATHYNVISSANYTNTTYAEKTGSPNNLSALKGKNVRLVIHCTSSADKYALFIDDVTVTQTKTGETVTYELVDEPEAGKDYVIVVGGTHAVTNSVYSNNHFINATSVVNNGDDTITFFADEESSLLYRAGGSASGWTFYNQAAGKYLGLNASDSYFLSMISTPWEWLYTGTDLDNQCTASSNLNSSNNAFRYLRYSVTYDDCFTTSTVTGQNVKFYKSVKNTYTVTFVDSLVTTGEGRILKTEEVEEGGSATPPEDPYHDGYVFTGWDKAYDNITEDVEIAAQYKSVSELTFTVTFNYMNREGAWITHTINDVPYNTGVTAPDAEAVQPAGYTFNSWDKKFDNITSSLTINAVYKQTATKKYEITLRAVYGRANITAKTHIYWFANNDVNGVNGGDVQRDLELGINEAINIPTPSNFRIYTGSKAGENTLTYEDHIFLGWARIDNETGTNPEGFAHPELNEDDLFLKWYPESGEYKVAKKLDNIDDVAIGSTVTQVAADGTHPYHDMYAVWATVFYVYHSGGNGEGNTVEKVVMTSTKFVDGERVPNKYDIAHATATGFLYGGYYKAYDGTSTGWVNAKESITWTASKNQASWKLDGTLNYAAMLETNTDANATAYTGGNEAWKKDDAYCSINGDMENGLAITPKAGTTYYLKEVPADKYLLPYLHYTYRLGYNNITAAWVVSDIDDLNYYEGGFVIVSSDNKATVVRTLSIVNGNGGHTETLSAQDTFGTPGYLSYLKVIEYSDPASQNQLIDLLQDNYSVKQYWVTPDGLLVTGTLMRTYNGVANTSSITGSNTAITSEIRVWTPAGN